MINRLILVLACLCFSTFVQAQDVQDDAAGVDEAIAKQLEDKKDFTVADLEKADAELNKQLSEGEKELAVDECENAAANLKSAQHGGDYQDIIKATNKARDCGIEVKTSGRRGG